MVNIASAYLTQWQRVQILGVVSSTILVILSDDVERWVKPHRNNVKVNCDANNFKNSAYLVWNGLKEMLMGS